MEEKNFGLIAIVAIVAIVGMVVLITGGGPARTSPSTITLPSGEQENVAGNARIGVQSIGNIKKFNPPSHSTDYLLNFYTQKYFYTFLSSYYIDNYEYYTGIISFPYETNNSTYNKTYNLFINASENSNLSNADEIILGISEYNNPANNFQVLMYKHLNRFEGQWVLQGETINVVIEQLNSQYPKISFKWPLEIKKTEMTTEDRENFEGEWYFDNQNWKLQIDLNTLTLTIKNTQQITTVLLSEESDINNNVFYTGTWVYKGQTIPVKFTGEFY